MRRAPAALPSSAGPGSWVGGGCWARLSEPEGAGAVRVLPAEVLSCEGTDDVGSLIIHLLMLFKRPDLKVSSGPTTVEFRLTTRWLPEAGFAALAAPGCGCRRRAGAAALKRAQAAGP